MVDKIDWLEYAKQGLIHPHCTFRRYWDLITMYFVIYTAIFLPFRIAFDEPAEGWWLVKDTLMVRTAKHN